MEEGTPGRRDAWKKGRTEAWSAGGLRRHVEVGDDEFIVGDLDLNQKSLDAVVVRRIDFDEGDGVMN